MTYAELIAELRAHKLKYDELRAKTELTAEERTAEGVAFDGMKAADAGLRALKEKEERDAFRVSLDEYGDLPPAAEDQRAITAPDQEIYRGSTAHKLGLNLCDIRTVSSLDTDRTTLKEARSRLQQCEKRNQAKYAETRKTENEETRAASVGGFTYGAPSDGSIALQGEVAMDLIHQGYNNSEALKRTRKRTLSPGTQFLEVVGIDETSRVTGSRGGGIRVYTQSELEEFTSSKTKFNKIRIEPSALTGHWTVSELMLRNVTFLGQEVQGLFREEYAYKTQDLVFRGTGVREAQGLLNAPCLVTVPKVSGQAAKTIVLDNILDMESRISNESSSLAYFINRDTQKQLTQLSISVGTGGERVPLFKNEYSMGVRTKTLNGLPCYVIEQASTLGTVGDIILCDLSQYYTVDTGSMREETSIHVHWMTDERAFRSVLMFDGQPRWLSPLTPANGTNTISPMVTLAAR